MTRSEPPVKTAPGLSAVLPGIGKKPILPFSAGLALVMTRGAAGHRDDLRGLALGEHVGLQRLGLVGVLGPLAERLELLVEGHARLGLRGVQRALPLVAVLDGEVAALVPDEAGQRVPGLARQVDAVVAAGVELGGVRDPLGAGLRRGGDARPPRTGPCCRSRRGWRRTTGCRTACRRSCRGRRGPGIQSLPWRSADLAGEVLHAAAGRVLRDLGVADLHHVRARPCWPARW